MAPKIKKTREAKPGELKEINILEDLEKLSRRPESRIDLQKLLENLSENSKIYAKHLFTSGPSSILSAAKACGLTSEEITLAMKELGEGIFRLKKS